MTSQNRASGITLPKLFFGLLGLFLCLGFFTLHEDTRSALWELGASFVLAPTVDLSPDGPLTLDVLENGQWIPRHSPLNLTEEWRGAYATVDALWDPMEGEGGYSDEGLVEVAKIVRASAIASWEWQGEGAVPGRVDWESLAVRLLQSTGGLILVGGNPSLISAQHTHLTSTTDSTQAQLFTHLHRAVLPPDVIYTEELHPLPVNGRLRSQPTVQSLYLPLNAAWARALLERAGAPEARLARPLVTYVRDDALLSRRQLRGVVQRALGLRAAPEMFGNLYDGAWAEKVEDAIAPIELVKGKAVWKGIRNTVLFVNTGARWAPKNFKMVKDKEELVKLYSEGVSSHILLLKNTSHYVDVQARTALSTLRSFARTTTLVRPTIPGHTHCAAFRTPVPSPAELAPPEQWAQSYGWAAHPALNDAWVAAMRAAQVPAVRPPPRRKGGAGRWGERGEAMGGGRPRGWVPVYWRSLLRPE